MTSENAVLLESLPVPKVRCFLEGSKNSPFCPSGKCSVWMEISVELRWMVSVELRWMVSMELRWMVSMELRWMVSMELRWMVSVELRWMILEHSEV